MNLANRIFKNNKTGEVVKVIDSFENIAILENKQKLDVTKNTLIQGSIHLMMPHARGQCNCLDISFFEFPGLIKHQ